MAYLFITILLSCLNVSIAYLPSSQIAALTDLYESLNGNQWICRWNLTELRFNKSLPSTYCGLHLQSLTNTTQTVTHFNFTEDNHLNGRISPSIDQLVDIQVIRVWNNHNITGSIPSSICNLTKLHHIDFFKQSFYGNVPECIGDLNLTHFRLVNTYSSRFHINYTAINLTINPMIIESFCQSSKNLTLLSLRSMTCNGSIPECIGYELPFLQHISFYNMDLLNSTLPKSIGNLSYLQYLELTDLPSLHGTIPPNILKHYNLRYLYIDNTLLTGTISTIDLCNNTKLIGLNLGSDVSFTMPTCIHKLKDLVDLGFEGKNIVGSIPKEICALNKLIFLYLGRTSMTGSVPTCIGKNLTNLVSLDLASDVESKGYYYGYDGDFPPLYLPKLRLLKIHNNHFTGTISNIFPLNAYPSLEVVLLHVNSFTDVDIGSTIKKLFEFSPNLLGISMYKQKYIGGAFPSFDDDIYLNNFSIFAVQELDIKGVLPSNLYFGQNVKEFTFSIYDNRLSSVLPEDLILSDTSSNNVIHGNLFAILNPLDAPDWIQDSEFLDADQLYLTGTQLITSWMIVIVSLLSFLFILIKKHYTFSYYITNGNYEFIENVKDIDQHLLNYKLLAITFILIMFYPFSNIYYAETPVLSYFCLYYFDTYASGDREGSLTMVKIMLIVLLIAYNMIALHTILNIVNGSKHRKNHTVFSLNDNIQMNQLHESLILEDNDDCDANNNKMMLDDVMFAFCNIKSCHQIMNLILWTFSFLTATGMLILYFVCEQLPEDNILGIDIILRKILEYSISFIITLNTAIIIPRLTSSLFQLFPKYIPTKNQNVIIMLLRTIVLIVIPLFVSFLLLGDCCNGWTNLWKPCQDPNHFEIFDRLQPSNYVVNDTDYTSGSTLTNKYVYNPVEL